MKKVLIEPHLFNNARVELGFALDKRGNRQLCEIVFTHIENKKIVCDKITIQPSYDAEFPEEVKDSQ